MFANLVDFPTTEFVIEIVLMAQLRIIQHQNVFHAIALAKLAQATQVNAQLVIAAVEICSILTV
jgi:hypothetical protein